MVFDIVFTMPKLNSNYIMALPAGLSSAISATMRSAGEPQELEDE